MLIVSERVHLRCFAVLFHAKRLTKSDRMVRPIRRGAIAQRFDQTARSIKSVRIMMRSA